MSLLDFTRFAVFMRSRSTSKSQSQTDTDPATSPIIGLADRSQPVLWPMAATGENCHLLTLGSSGAGKTILISNGIVNEVTCRDIQENATPPLSTLVVDPKGDLIQAIIQGMAAIEPRELNNVSYLDPFSTEHSFPFNLNKLDLGETPLDIRALQIASLVSEVSTARGSQKHLGMGARQLDVLQHVILGALACEHEQANLLWALDALLIPKGMKKLAALTTSKRARQFLLTARLGDELRISCAARIRSALAASDSLERLVCADNCVQFGDLLAPGKICLVDLGRPVGGLTSLQEFYANLICRLAIEHLMERPSPWDGHHCRIVVDEAQIVAPVLADRAEVILTTGRSRGMSLTAISQGTTLLHQASETLLRVLMTNTPTKFIGRLAAPDAELLAREQAPGLGIEESLSVFRGRFTSSVTNLQDREFFLLTPGQRQRFVTADVDMEGWQQATEEQRGEIEAAKRRLALPSETRPRVTLTDVSPAPKSRSRRRRKVKKPPADQGRKKSGSKPSSTKKPTAPNKNQLPLPSLEKTKPAKPRSRWG